MPKNLRELLTAAIDGELSPAERKTAERLLKESEAARVLYGQLKADAARLKSLPRVPAPPDLADNVMSVIQDRAMTPTPLPPSRKPTPKFNWSAMPIWVSLITAASVLIVISIGSYLYFTASERYYRDQPKNVAKTPAGASNSIAADTPARDSTAVPPIGPGPRPEVIAMQPRIVPEVGPLLLGPEVGPSPRDVTDIYTGPPGDLMPEIESPQIDRIRVSHLVNPHELADDEATRKKLTAEMKKDELIRLDLFCRSTPKAFDMVLAGLKA